METIHQPSISVNSMMLLNDYNGETILDKSSKPSFSTKIRSGNFPKHKGRILIQDNIEMIQCKGNCGKYDHHK